MPCLYSLNQMGLISKVQVYLHILRPKWRITVSDKTTIFKQVIIIGGGLSGLLVADKLLLNGIEDFAILDENAYSSLGGPAYHKDSIGLLNAPAGGLSLNADNHKEFAEFLNVRGYFFAERKEFGRYIEHKLGFLYSYFIHTQATGIVEKGGIYQIITQNEVFEAPFVILATGNDLPAWPKDALDIFEVFPKLSNPWNHSIMPMEGDITLGIIGMGLTMLDYLTWAKIERLKGREIKIISTNRNKSLMGRHPVSPPDSVSYEFLELPQRLEDWISFLKLEFEKVGDYRSVINALRIHTPQVWMQFTDEERCRFLRHLLPFWNNVRHRAPSEVIDLFEQARLERWLKPIYTGNPSEILIEFQAGDYPKNLWIINATGPESRISATQNRLLKSALDAGLVKPHSSKLGIEADASGRIRQGLFALGNLMRGVLFECTAVPELLSHASTISNSISQSIHKN